MVGQRQKVPFKHLISTVTCRIAFLGRRRIQTVSFMYFIPSNHNKILLKWLMCFIQKKKKRCIPIIPRTLFSLCFPQWLFKNKTPGPVIRRAEHLQLPPTSATILFWTLLKIRPAAQWFLLLMKCTKEFLIFTQNLRFYSVNPKDSHKKSVYCNISSLLKDETMLLTFESIPLRSLWVSCQRWR